MVTKVLSVERKPGVFITVSACDVNDLLDEVERLRFIWREEGDLAASQYAELQRLRRMIANGMNEDR